MAKIVLSPVTNGNTLSTINDNFAKIEAEFQDKALYRENPVGETNTVQNDLDIDGNDIFNVGTLGANDLLIDGVPISGGDIASVPQLRADVATLQGEMNTAQADIINLTNVEAANNAASLRTSGVPINTIPNAADRIGKFLAFDPTGQPISSFGTGADLGLRTDLAATNGGVNVGFQQTGTGSVVITADALFKSLPVNVKQFGASTANTAAANATAIQNAVNANDHVVINGGGEFLTNTITLTRPNSKLEIEAGTTVTGSSPTASTIIVNAANVSIVGGGTVKNTPTFNGVQGEFFYGVIYVTGDNATIQNIVLDGVPKFGIHMKQTSGHKLHNVTIIGRVDKSSYNEGDTNTLNHAGIEYDPPPASGTSDVSLLITGCDISGCISGMFAGNYGATAKQGGIVVNASSFRHCWDHGVYINGTAADNHIISSCNFFEVRRPIVSGGFGSVVVDNIMTEITNDASMEQLVSVRDAVDCVIANNVIRGFGACIHIAPLLGTVLTGNLVTNNVVKATGINGAGSNIRVQTTTTVFDNVISNNSAEGYPTINFAVIDIAGGNNNSIINNRVSVLNTNYGIRFENQTNGNVSGNMVKSVVNAGSATTVTMMFINNVLNSDIRLNEFDYKSGGTNVTLRGISFAGTSTGNNVDFNTFDLTAASLVGKTAIINVGTTVNNLRDNTLDRSAPTTANVIWTGATASVVVTNPNILSTSRITVVPINTQAGTVQKTNGVYWVAANGSFTLATADGANTGATSTWRWWTS